jgi:phosphoribosylaminoimidazolecarboxamide formyltransferase/IMP cyclohydrolase
VKHTNPCGISVDDDQSSAYEGAFQGDSISAYGGIVGFNTVVTKKTAEVMRGVLFDIIVAPDYEVDALDILRKRKRTRVLKANYHSGPFSNLEVLTVTGGILIQTSDQIQEDPSTWKVVTDRHPTETELRDLEFAWSCLRHIKSNTIVLAKDNTLVGMGAGQPNRLVSVHLALRISGDRSIGSSLASDAFMPFADNVELAAKGGVTAIIQPGGSIRDEEVIEAANQHSISMMFTGIRHFNH